MIDLSSEDALRLHVLVQNAEAIRIDENRMVVYGLNGERELKAPLNPNCRSDKYLMRVRETLAAAVLDSPGGYPVFLRRWTRMGQIDNEQMDRLLKLGEPEAVMAVVCSPGLTDELARRAWWVAPYSEYARRMLNCQRVVNGTMGPILARHLVEHLPFETEQRDMLETVRLVLQPGLIDDEQRQRLWDAGRSKKSYRVGFLATTPNALPEPQSARPEYAELYPQLAPLIATGNGAAKQLAQILSEPGQRFVATATDALRRPADQEVVAALLNAIGHYFADLRWQTQRIDSLTALWQAALAPLQRANISAAELQAAGADPTAITADPEQTSDDAPGPETQRIDDISTLWHALPTQRPELLALLLLAHIDEHLLTPIFARSDAIGTVMRRHIAPIIDPLQLQFAQLLGHKSPTHDVRRESEA